jgi:FlaA1/EpsC-like NDP-sugar epimerase
MLLRKLVGVIHPRMAVVIHDLLVAALAWWIAKMLRYALRPDEIVSFHLLELPIVLSVQGLVFRWTGLYKSVWRFASLPDLWNIARAVVAGTFAIYISLFLYDRLAGVPRSVLLLYPGLLALFLGTPRLLYRYWKDSRSELLHNQTVKRVLIVGADRAGEVLARDLHRDSRYAVVGFVDDKASLRGANINGRPVLGRLDQLPDVAREASVNMLLIALPGASTTEMRRIVALCDATDLPYRTVPRLEDVVAGRAHFNEIKEVAIEDLLGRDAVELDWTAIRETLSAKRVLITGGGGSIGAELCRQVARLGAHSLTVVEQSEYNLYRICQEIRADFP